jgi:histidinol-phosphate aminotransferase
MNKLPPHLPVIVDEAYFEYADDDDILNSADLIRTSDRTVIGLRTFSKFHGLASMRVGYAMAQPEICNLLKRASIPYNISALAERAAVAALAAKNHQREIHSQVSGERARIQQVVAELGLEYVPSQGAGVLIELPCESNEFYKRYADEGIFLSRGAFFDKMTLFPVGRREQNDRNLGILRSLV